MKTALILLFLLTPFSLFTQQNPEAELFIYWVNSQNQKQVPSSNYFVQVSTLTDVTTFDKFLNPLPGSIMTFFRDSELYLDACYEGEGTHGDGRPASTNGTVFYGKYKAEFGSVENGNFNPFQPLTRYIDFRDDEYGQHLNGQGPSGHDDGYENQDFFIVCHSSESVPSAWQVSMYNAVDPGSTTQSNSAYGIWNLATKLPNASPGQHTTRFKNFKLNVDLPFDLTYQVQVNEASYTFTEFNHTIDSALGFAPKNLTVTVPNYLTDIKCGTFPYFLSRWSDGVLIDPQRTFTTGNEYVGINAIYKRVLNRAHTISGPAEFDRKMNVTFTSSYPRQSGGSYYCEWWIKYDFNQTWQNLGNGNQSINIMTTASWGYSFDIKCFMKDYYDTVGVWSNDLRCEYVGSQCNPCNPLEEAAELDFPDHTSMAFDSPNQSADSRWYPIESSHLTRRQKKAILRPMIETVKLLNHRFRWKASDTFEAGNDSMWVLEDDENLTKTYRTNDTDNDQVFDNITLDYQDGAGQLTLNSNYPNPFNPSTTISYDTRKDGYVRLVIYNTLGQKVRTLVDGTVSKGSHRVVWDGKNDKGSIVPTGIYFSRLECDDQIRSRKMMFIK
ncbi:MAG: T9SS type A sorting domain-containing protein [Bacteroidetes bacterium]|nr:T9SS type A sorting domain-containing protein [Bacteroidota bacterium]